MGNSTILLLTSFPGGISLDFAIASLRLQSKSTRLLSLSGDRSRKVVIIEKHIQWR